MKKVGFEISTTEGLNPGNKDEYTAKYIYGMELLTDVEEKDLTIETIVMQM